MKTSIIKLAKKAEVTPDALHKIRRGDRSPSLTLAATLEHITGYHRLHFLYPGCKIMGKLYPNPWPHIIGKAREKDHS
jgi:hypothetical protein